MNEKDTSVVEQEVAAEERKTIIGAALSGLQQALTILQKFGVIDATQALTVPTLAATPEPTTKHKVRDAKGHFVPATADTTSVAAKPKKVRVKKVAEKPYKKPTAPDTVPEFVKWFIQTEERNLYSVKRGQWEVIEGVRSADPELRKAHMLVFHGRRLQGNDTAMGRHIVCIRPVDGIVPIFNASRVRYGTSWAAQQNPQRLAEEYGAVPVPFESVISTQNGAGLDPAKMEVIAWGGSERLLIPPVNNGWRSSEFHIINRHFAGAVLLKIETRYFLFDADREELNYCNFNPFFTELIGPATTIAEAYEQMAPIAVHEARKDGIHTVRQGEFFFTRVPDSEVLGTIKDTFDKRTVEIITERIDTLAAAVVNTSENALRESVETFVENYAAKDHMADKPDDVIKDVARTMAPLIKRLSGKNGPEVSWTGDAKQDPDRYGRNSSYGEGHGNTHVDYLREELAVRLHQEHGADRKYGIQFATVLTARLIDPKGVQTGGQGHIATAMMIKPTDDPEVRAFYVRGAVLHRGRQHRPVYLPGWYRAHVNTSLRNWTVDGAVD